MPHCSLSCVRRWGYIIMDHCCKDLGIRLVPGRHCPRQVDVSGAWKVASQSSSTVSTAKGIVSHRPFVLSKENFLTRVGHHYSCFSCEPRVCIHSHHWTCSQQIWRPLLATHCLKFFSNNNIQGFVIYSKQCNFSSTFYIHSNGQLLCSH